MAGLGCEAGDRALRFVMLDEASRDERSRDDAGAVDGGSWALVALLRSEAAGCFDLLTGCEDEGAAAAIDVLALEDADFW